MHQYKLNLDKYLDSRLTALVGRPNGEALLEKLMNNKINFEQLEKDYDSIVVEIPNRIVTINKSYFLGWLETRILALKKEKFLEKYSFVTTDHIEKRFDEFIDAALLSASPNEILNIK